jgi:hypothetical protein
MSEDIINTRYLRILDVFRHPTSKRVIKMVAHTTWFQY